MRILIVCENYIPHYGGAEVVFKNLAERYVQRGHQVSLLTHQLKGTKKREVINGVHVYRVPSWHSRYIFTFAAIGKAIKLARKHDVIQTTSFNGAPPAWVAAKLTKKTVAITVHEVWIGKWRKVTGFPWWKSFIHDVMERCIYSLPFDKYICVSNATKKDLLKIGIKPKKVVTVHNGLDYQFWNPDRYPDSRVKKIRKDLGLKDKFVYFSWGRPGESKGFEYALKAVPLIKKKMPNAVFLLMLGSVEKYPKKYNQLMSLIKKLKIEDAVKVIPSVGHDQLGYYIKAADCVVIPSIAEGFGYTTAETVAMGKPVVVSDAGSLPEVISGKFQMFHSKNVQELAFKVVKVANGDYKQTMIKKFRWEDSVQKYLSAYDLMNAAPQ